MKPQGIIDTPALKRRLRVEYRSEILGHKTFWEGESDDIGSIRNFPARETARKVAQDGKSRKCGMWYVSVLDE